MMNIPMVKSAASTVMVMLISSSFVVTAEKKQIYRALLKSKVLSTAHENVNLHINKQ